MSIIPSVKVSTSAILQRSYFASELFVTAARADIESLLSTFEHLAEDGPEPFAVFKGLWAKEGWNYAHLLAGEPVLWHRGSLTPQFASLIERVKEDEEELVLAGAIFGLFTLFKMQLTVATLYRVNHIPISIDTFQILTTLAKSSSEPHQPYILYILRDLLSESHLHILPPSALSPQSPSILPHSSIVRNDEGAPTKQTVKGGKTKTELDRAGRRKWQMLGTWVDERATSSAVRGPPLPEREDYDADKLAVIESVPEDVERSAEENALARLTALSTDQTGPSEGIERFEKMLLHGKHILRDQWGNVES